jgi:hypothetical protein
MPINPQIIPDWLQPTAQPDRTKRGKLARCSTACMLGIFQMPRFFISYRRIDQFGEILAHLVCRELRRRYGPDSVFLDVDSRSPGLSFRDKVEAALNQSDAVLAIIGPEWLRTLQERLNDTRDWVRYELRCSLRRKFLPVVPVCYPGVEVPRPEHLPEDLEDLGWRDGVTLDPRSDFELHLTRLLSDLERLITTLEGERRGLIGERTKLVSVLSAGYKAPLSRLMYVLETRLPNNVERMRQPDARGHVVAFS